MISVASGLYIERFLDTGSGKMLYDNARILKVIVNSYI